VTRELDPLIEQPIQPQNVRSDDGPEFTSRRMLGWAEERKINLIHIQPGRPMQKNFERPRSSLAYKTPAEFSSAPTTTAARYTRPQT
jgi:transposase InsO family protein